MKKKIYTTSKTGEKQEYDVLLTFKMESNKKNYIIYTDNSIDATNKLRIFASIYDPETLELLGSPSSKNEWVNIYDVLGKVLNKQ